MDARTRGDGRGGAGDTTEDEWIVDDGGEESGGRDERLRVVQAVDRGVVGGLGSDQQILGQAAHGLRSRAASKNFREHRGRDLAAAAAAVAELGEANCVS